MPWSLGTVVNNYNQPVGVQAFAGPGSTTDYSTTPISGGTINVIVPLRGTLSLVDLGTVPGSEPLFGIDAYYLSLTWSFRYATDTKINVTIDAHGELTLQQTV
jgi:hypothetical protein